ncbi:hypothetical protein CMI41_04090 [Candidatus Pacearchaeota archaeon]|nr:hypothetical protein [Candidatus Pacearchaeota archaeon]|tara:strand:- start:14619 stop:15215 length:597 start_codon:yes stop_codon:yes gene_type:complete
MVKKKKTKKKVSKEKEESKEEVESSEEKKEETLEEKFEEDVESQVPLEMSEGITDTLDQVDMSELLHHRGEGPQKQRAHLEEELAMQGWKPPGEENGEEVNYGAVKKDSVGEKSYVDNREVENSSKEVYKTINPYSAEDDEGSLSYSIGQEVVEDPSKIGEIRRENRSRLEIGGSQKTNNLNSNVDAMKGHRQNENYE